MKAGGKEPDSGLVRRFNNIRQEVRGNRYLNVGDNCK